MAVPCECQVHERGRCDAYGIASFQVHSSQSQRKPHATVGSKDNKDSIMWSPKNKNTVVGCMLSSSKGEVAR